jgi:hypothetical protein
MRFFLRYAFASVALLCLGQVTQSSPAHAGTRMYTGSVRLLVASSPGSSYSIPFGSMLSYPSMNNLPTGDLATTAGPVPRAIQLGSDQMTLQTSLSSTNLPTSWGTNTAYTSFAGGHESASFFAGGAPGAASAAPVSSLPASQFGVAFSGGSERFGGTMALLGTFRTIWGPVTVATPTVRCSACAVLKRPLSPIGGAFGGAAMETTFINGTGSAPTFFDATVWGFPWTTGNVTARAPAGSLLLSATAKGSDQRTPSGKGQVQLVSPFLVRYTLEGSSVATYQPGVAIVKLHFVPEPSSALLLGAGGLALAALWASSRRVR